MAELSLPWDGTATGDKGPFTDDEWRDVFRALGMGGGLVGAANVGVVGGLLNGLRMTTAGNNDLTINTGYAIVDGTVYYNSASKSTTSASPSVGTTGRMVVLKKDWTAQTIRIAIITSNDGTAAIPSVTQSGGTTWEIPLCSFTITTGGVIAALTDLREFTNPISIPFVIDGGGAVISTGIAAGDIWIPRALELTGWTVTGDQSGAILVDVWADSYANYPATNADSIAGTDEPEIVASATKAQNLDIATGGQWTLALAAGQNVRFNVDSVTTLTYVTVTLHGAG